MKTKISNVILAGGLVLLLLAALAARGQGIGGVSGGITAINTNVLSHGADGTTQDGMILTGATVDGTFAGDGAGITNVNNITGSANYATNSILGVLVVVNNSATNYFGFAGSAFTNALRFCNNLPPHTLATVFVGLGYYTNNVGQDGFIISNQIPIQGSGMGTWDGNTNGGTAYGGTVIGPIQYCVGPTYNLGGCSNIFIRDLAIIGTGAASGFTPRTFGLEAETSPINCTLENVSIIQPVRTANTEPLYLSGCKWEVRNLRCYNFGGHGLIVKGVKDMVIDGLYMENCPGSGLSSIFIEPNNGATGNGCVSNVTIRNFLFNSGLANITAVAITAGDNAVCDKVTIETGDIYHPYTTASNLLAIAGQGTNTAISNIRYRNLHAWAPYQNIIQVNVGPTNTLDSVSLAGCSIVSSNFVDPCSFVFPTTYTNAVRLNDITINGRSYYGFGNQYTPGTGRYGFQTNNALNVVGGLWADNITAAGQYTGNAAGLSNYPVNLFLVCRYNFDEGTNMTAYDSSGNKITAGLFNGTTWTNGLAGKGLAIERGVGAYASNALPAGITNLTAAMWIYRNVTNSGKSTYYCHAVGNLAGTTFATLSAGGSYPTHALLLYDGANQANTAADTFPESGSNTWIHLAWSFDGTRTPKTKFYTNGVLIATTTDNVTTLGTLERNTVGNQFPNSAVGMDGRVDNFELYKRALTDAEVAEIYRSQAQSSGYSIVGNGVGLTNVTPASILGGWNGVYVAGTSQVFSNGILIGTNAP